MRTKFFSMLALAALGSFTNAQVGVNTNTPETTLDVRAKNHLGAVTSTDGVLVPRVNSLATAGTVNGQLVYLIADNGGFTKGFHYWDGTMWTPFIGVAAGDPTKDAWVDNASQTRIEVGTLSNGTTVRPAGTEMVIKDDGKVGIGTAAPAEKLDVNGKLIVRDIPTLTNSTNNTILISDTNGVISKRTLADAGIARPSVFVLTNTINDFLNGIAAGGAQTVPMSQTVSSPGNGITYNSSTSTITFQPGTYMIIFNFEGQHVSSCTLSSYFVDFPGGVRVHRTASHSTGIYSSHGGNMVYTANLTAVTNWPIRLGRGQSGNCYGSGGILHSNATSINILRIK
ncbi:hypothetical protein [Chryseobacterium gossypii]|uniref:hypothetical protein n=1 Tax=Chryseobacterium gossypii TaxID=3231602 RepID=UPI003523CEAC